MSEEQIIQKLLEFSDKLYEEGKTKELSFVPYNTEANNLVITDKNAYLFSVLFDWGQDAERVWEFPWELKKRLKHLDMKFLYPKKDTLQLVRMGCDAISN